MSDFPTRIAAVLAVIAVLGMTACSTSTSTAATSTHADFYWSAAKETYALGDYAKTADHLERLIDDGAYSTRALPWYLVLTSGMASGYIELADQYTAGARHNKGSAAAFHAKAAAYRTIASQWAMRFAQNSDKLRDVPLGSMTIGFALPKGSAAEPEQLAQIASGIELRATDAEMAETRTLQHSVLMAVCQAVGAPQDVAKAEEILARVPAMESRSTFGNAIGEMLDAESYLYSRNKLDEPAKLAALHERAEMARKEGARAGSARIVAAAAQQ